MSTDFLNRLCKWRGPLTGRILGTRTKEDAQAQGFRDLFEKLLILRVEVTALTALLIEKNALFTAEEFGAQINKEAELLCEQYAKRFPGLVAHDWGIEMKMPEAQQTMQGWPP